MENHKPKKLDRYERKLISAFDRIYMRVTPTQVAKATKMNPVTAKKKIQNLSKMGFLKCEEKGNRLYCERTRKKAPKD